MRKTERIVFTAMMVATSFVISVVMKAVPIMQMPQGGSVSLAMLPLFILAFTLGTGYGIVGGVIYGLINFIFDGYGYHWASIIFDYILAFGVLGLAGIFKKYALRGKKRLNFLAYAGGMIFPSILRFVFHTIAGTLAWDTPLLASAAYNGPYMGCSLLLCLVVGFLMYPQLSRLVQKKDRPAPAPMVKKIPEWVEEAPKKSETKTVG